MKSLCLLLASALLLAGCNCGPPDPCAGGGTATLDVRFTGLPDGVAGNAALHGPSEQTLSAPQVLTGVGSGSWTVTAEKVTVADPRVRTVYAPTISPATFCVAREGTQVIDVAWSKIPTSNALWASNANNAAGTLLGFTSAQLAATGTPAATVGAAAKNGGAIAFDKDGNLWATGGTTAEPPVQRTPAAALGTSGPKNADIKIDIAGLDCLPRLNGIAFDKAGNLWVSSGCKNQVMQLAAASLGASGTVTPAITLATVDAPSGLAFDKAGNLFVADATTQRVWRFEAGSLAAGAAPSVRLGGKASDAPGNNALLTPTWLAFDKNGDLWANDFGANVFFRLAAADLAGAGDKTVKPGVRITLPVGALLEGFAFDDEGGLWTAYSAGKIARVGPAQLTVDTSSGAPTTPATILTSASVGSAANVALYPAPASSPLFHALP